MKSVEQPQSAGLSWSARPAVPSHQGCPWGYFILFQKPSLSPKWWSLSREGGEHNFHIVAGFDGINFFLARLGLRGFHATRTQGTSQHSIPCRSRPAKSWDWRGSEELPQTLLLFCCFSKAKGRLFFPSKHTRGNGYIISAGFPPKLKQVQPKVSLQLTPSEFAETIINGRQGLAGNHTANPCVGAAAPTASSPAPRPCLEHNYDEFCHESHQTQPLMAQ